MHLFTAPKNLSACVCPCICRCVRLCVGVYGPLCKVEQLDKWHQSRIDWCSDGFSLVKMWQMTEQKVLIPISPLQCFIVKAEHIQTQMLINNKVMYTHYIHNYVMCTSGGVQGQCTCIYYVPIWMPHVTGVSFWQMQCLRNIWGVCVCVYVCALEKGLKGGLCLGLYVFVCNWHT